DVEALILALAAIAGEDHRPRQRDLRIGRDAAGKIVLAPFHHCLDRAPPEHQAAMIGGPIGNQRHRLEPAAIRAGGLEARGEHLGRDILLGDRQFGGAGVAALHRIGSEELDMRLQRRGARAEILGEGGNGGEQRRREQQVALHAHLAPAPS
ncbi:hypothetical protein QU38_01930, partial [Staphylococcus aureus]